MGEVLQFETKDEKMSSFPEVFNYWKWEKEIPDDIIEKIMKIGEGKWEEGITKSKEGSGDKSVRKTDIIWNNDQWLYDLVWPYMTSANTSAGWNLNIDSAESFQLGRYSKGGHYDYHTDGDGINPTDAPGNEFLHGKTRKISMVLWLNEDFEGGEFEMHPALSKVDGKIKPTKGTLIFFPSWHMHKVHPVTKGTRYSLVTWFNGEPVR